jgi:hypothetical protein
MDVQEDGQRFRVRIVEGISNILHSDVHHKFFISVTEDEYKETITYNLLLDFIQKNEENDNTVWHFSHIVGHQGPLLRHDTDYNGLKFNVLVEWENGEITTEPLLVIAADDPVTCAVYAREKNNSKPKLSRKPNFSGTSRICTRTRRISKTFISLTFAPCNQKLHVHFVYTLLIWLFQSWLKLHSKYQIRKALPRPFTTPSFPRQYRDAKRFLRELSTCFHVTFHAKVFSSLLFITSPRWVDKVEEVIKLPRKGEVILSSNPMISQNLRQKK